LLTGFGQRKDKAIFNYRKFVAAGKGQPSVWLQLKNQVYLGDQKLVENMHSLIDGNKELSEVPSSQRRSKPKEIAYYEQNEGDRNTAIARAYRSGGSTLKEIGDYFDLQYSTVSGIVNNPKSKT
jgi:hypothetical protein